MTFTRIKRFALIVFLLVTVVLGLCYTPSRKFDSAEWKAGNATTRGSMTQDLMDRQLLVGKSPAEVEGLLGKPDLPETDWYGYNVVTIARCRFWECRLGVVFDHSSSLVTFVAVND